jgi:preprotein translocase subunit SecF
MIQLFHQVDVDWLSKRRIFAVFSLGLLLSGLVSIGLRELTPGGSTGFNLGVDFTGGSVLTVAFRQPPDADQLRDALAKSGMPDAGVQTVTDKMNYFLVRLSRQSRAEFNYEADSQTHPNSDRARVLKALATFGEGNAEILGAETVGPVASSDLRNRAVAVTLLALVGMGVYIWYRFELSYGMAAAVEVIFNVLTTLGMFSIFQWEINITVIAALLTLVGFTMNDAVVIFDRVRENRRLHRRDSIYKLTNDAINQTLSRTVITAGLVFLTVLALVLFGGETLRSFSLAMMFGIVFGTYSTIAVACPLKVWLELRAKRSELRDAAAVTRRSITTPKSKTRVQLHAPSSRLNPDKVERLSPPSI